jgi:hypothetical protein
MQLGQHDIRFLLLKRCKSLVGINRPNHADIARAQVLADPLKEVGIWINGKNGLHQGVQAGISGRGADG